MGNQKRINDLAIAEKGKFTTTSMNLLDITDLPDIKARQKERRLAGGAEIHLARTPLEFSDGAYILTDRMNNIGRQVSHAFGENLQASETKLDTARLWREAIQPGDGFLFKNTNRPPMLDGSYWYSSNITRKFETELMHNLPKTGTIRQAEIVAKAKKICGGDPELTALTLANFSKNIASVARDQSNPGSNEGKHFPSNTYSKKQVSSFWSRLEHLDPQSNNYDRAGEFYHFYGAIYAYTLGLGFGVEIERKTFRHPNKVENGASQLGIDVAASVFAPKVPRIPIVPNPQPAPSPFAG